MPRNKYPGICYRCKTRVEVGQGHFERFPKGWATQHAECAIKYRGTDFGKENVKYHKNKSENKEVQGQ